GGAAAEAGRPPGSGRVAPAPGRAGDALGGGRGGRARHGRGAGGGVHDVPARRRRLPGRAPVPGLAAERPERGPGPRPLVRRDRVALLPEGLGARVVPARRGVRLPGAGVVPQRQVPRRGWRPRRGARVAARRPGRLQA
ncbi:unnamed protein product, partial [Prorocentrum cordatum]